MLSLEHFVGTFCLFGSSAPGWTRVAELAPLWSWEAGAARPINTEKW